MLLYPGLLVQMITTKQPSDDMIEVAIVSMEEALVADGETVPAGSADFPRDPMRPRRRRRVTGAPPATAPDRPDRAPTDPPPGS